MLMQAATLLPTSSSASFSAAARSGRLVRTSKVPMLQTFVDGGLAQPNAEPAFQPRVVLAARFAHEGENERIEAPFRLVPRHPRRARQSVRVGHQIEPV